MSARTAGKRARGYANQTGKKAWVIFEKFARRYLAVTSLPEGEMELSMIAVICEVEPCKSK